MITIKRKQSAEPKVINHCFILRITTSDKTMDQFEIGKIFKASFLAAIKDLPFDTTFEIIHPGPEQAQQWNTGEKSQLKKLRRAMGAIASGDPADPSGEFE